MKTKTTIEELTQENLVDLLCTATYGSSWLEIYAPDQEDCGIERDDCCEDRWAKALLHGKTIYCVDHYAENEHYGNLPWEYDRTEDGDGNVTYHVTLQDIKDGLQKCADGDAGSWCATSFRAFQEGEGGMDNPMAEMLMQIILFGELIYG